MKNIKLTVEYDGTNYAGWQKQKNAITVQQKIEDAIYSLTDVETEAVGSSRTDSGVHARRFVCNFLTESFIPANSFRDALNSKLPEDIVVINSEEVDCDFHARYSSTGKQYSYTILNRVEPSAIDRNYVYHYKKILDYQSMQSACRYFVGTHDFSAFKSSGSSVKTSVRTVRRAFLERDKDKIIFFVEGDGFLYNMVRIMVGTLIDVGVGKIKPEKIEEILILKDRRKAGITVPPTGLCLEVVYYN